MNRSDDLDMELRDQLRSAIGAEPPMESLPYDDVVRGRRRERRRHWTTVGAAATIVPALSLGTYAVAGSFGDGAGSGPSTVLAPAAGGESTEPGNNSPGTVTADCSMSPVPVGGDGSTQPEPVPGNVVEGSAAAVSVGPAQGFEPGSGNGLQARAVRGGPGVGPVGGGGDRSVFRGKSPQLKSEAGGGDCLAVEDGTPIDSPSVDRVMAALIRHVDPSGSHAGMTIAGGSVGDADSGKASGIYVGYEWTDGDRSGMVSVSIEESTFLGGDSCSDPSIVNGPEVTCETRTLDDGTTVLVGRGQQAGAERVTVRYERPDGTTVWATSDEAIEQWWTDRSGPEPLTSPPVTVDELIDLVRDPEVRL